MEKHRPPVYPTEEHARIDPMLTVDEALRRIQASDTAAEQLNMRRALEGYRAEKERKRSRRKWSGRLTMVLGAVTLLGSCPLYVLATTPWVTVGYGPLLVALGLIVGGYALSSWRPRLKDTNEALLAALKFGNRLTAPRLALEMDCSLDRAERIIQELVRSGVAEIDLDHKDPQGAITYMMRGL
jgi:hypothetical protein